MTGKWRIFCEGLREAQRLLWRVLWEPRGFSVPLVSSEGKRVKGLKG